jgi:hypothetical protein
MILNFPLNSCGLAVTVLNSGSASVAVRTAWREVVSSHTGIREFVAVLRGH